MVKKTTTKDDEKKPKKILKKEATAELKPEKKKKVAAAKPVEKETKKAKKPALRLVKAAVVPKEKKIAKTKVKKEITVPTTPKPASPAPAKAPAAPKPAKPKIEPKHQAVPPVQPPPQPTKTAPIAKPAPAPAPPVVPVVVAKIKLKIPQIITVGELAEKLKVKPPELIKKLMLIKILATINQRLDPEVVSIIAEDYGFEAEIVPLYGEDILAKEDEKDNPVDLISRPPVVTIMGHVDHGKTSLLDAIRETNVAGGEAGGITQHIGAYKVSLPKGDIVFLDTPGHEAFTAMRARGAQSTDIVVLVVAADDGVMPQTIEAINHAKAANVPIIVAVNKIDMPAANVQKIKQELAGMDLASEDWGGKTIFVEVSAKKKIGIETLLEMILLEAEMKELKANPKTKARGVVVEAKLDKGRGPVATLLIQKGTLYPGDLFVAGQIYGKVRAMLNDKLEKVLTAGPATPVEVLGLNGLPQAGDSFQVVADEREARHISSMRQEIKKLDQIHLNKAKISLDELYEQIKQGKLKELKIIIKADVQGSAEALKESLLKLPNKEVKINVIHCGIGGITESDVILASISNAIIIGFNVRPQTGMEALVEKEKVDMRLYRIIYEVIDDVKKALEGMLEPDVKEIKLGQAVVRQIFKLPKGGVIAGSYINEGLIPRTANVRLVRDNVVIFEGKLASLRRFKDDVKEVAAGFECGIGIENFNDLKAGDSIEAYKLEKVMRKLEANS
ncbi:MAG: translation initiation factor IF-2 [bacterium]|nr:translation initiation factor IF-2 [bacterium]MDD5757005.1 translation initiation factor IF-2 [bacterium]